jgi:hypothetical protein
MGSFIHHDRIAEKLEIARTMGLVTNYLVAPIGPTRRPEAGVKVWCSPSAAGQAVKQYLTRLLDGLVAEGDIVITPPFAASDTIPAVAPQPEGVDDGAAAVPVQVAA